MRRRSGSLMAMVRELGMSMKVRSSVKGEFMERTMMLTGDRVQRTKMEDGSKCGFCSDDW